MKIEQPEHPLPLTGPSLRSVAVRCLELGWDDPAVRMLTRMSAALKRTMKQIEAERVATRLEGLPRHEVQQLAADRACRSSRTVRRWWATEAEQDD